MKEKFLGKTTVYVDKYDPTLLVPIPREERREYITSPMNGIDVWTCYEVSFLLTNGVPDNMVLRIGNPANSKNIFESKSLKLYLNSFNNTKFENRQEVIHTISKDLSDLTCSEVLVTSIDHFVDRPTYIQSIEEHIEITKKITQYSYDPSLLEIRPQQVLSQELYSNLLRSNCEVTGQPDWGSIYVNIVGGREVDKESFLRYIISFRNHQEFHEPTCERIFNDLYNKTNPVELYVECNYTRRGGIDINPIRTTNKNLSRKEFISYLFKTPKTLRQ